MGTLECRLKHLPLKDGDIVTVQGLTIEEFHEIMSASWKWRNGGPNVMFVLLPEEGAFMTQSWERLQEWQEERLKDDQENSDI
jgi:hypothetical protein